MNSFKGIAIGAALVGSVVMTGEATAVPIMSSGETSLQTIINDHYCPVKD